MSLQQDCWLEEIPEETAQLGEQLLKANNLYRFVGENINPLLQLSDYV
jgi:hypothetical protein